MNLNYNQLHDALAMRIILSAFFLNLKNCICLFLCWDGIFKLHLPLPLLRWYFQTASASSFAEMVFSNCILYLFLWWDGIFKLHLRTSSFAERWIFKLYFLFPILFRGGTFTLHLPLPFLRLYFKTATASSFAESLYFQIVFSLSHFLQRWYLHTASTSSFAEMVFPTLFWGVVFSTCIFLSLPCCLELSYVLQHDSGPAHSAIFMQKFLREDMLSKWHSELWPPVSSPMFTLEPKIQTHNGVKIWNGRRFCI
jgi:hypothetical protein